VSTPAGGYADFQASSIWRGTPLAAANYTVTSGSPILVQQDVTNFSSLSIHLNLNSGTGITVAVDFFTDSTLAVYCGQCLFTLAPAGTTLLATVPCLGNYAYINITTGQAGNQGITLTVIPTNLGAGRPAYPGCQNSVDGLAVSVGAGNSLVAVLPYVVEGNGEIFVQCGNAGKSFNLEADAIAESGAILSNLFRETAVTGQAQGSFLAPAFAVQLLIKNNDVAAQNFSYHCQVLGE
jgi:hypothetical protein